MKQLQNFFFLAWVTTGYNGAFELFMLVQFFIILTFKSQSLHQSEVKFQFAIKK